jgi:hypothetical protein
MIGWLTEELRIQNFQPEQINGWYFFRIFEGS